MRASDGIQNRSEALLLLRNIKSKSVWPRPCDARGAHETTSTEIQNGTSFGSVLNGNRGLDEHQIRDHGAARASRRTLGTGKGSYRRGPTRSPTARRSGGRVTSDFRGTGDIGKRSKVLLLLRGIRSRSVWPRPHSAPGNPRRRRPTKSKKGGLADPF